MTPTVQAAYEAMWSYGLTCRFHPGYRDECAECEGDRDIAYDIAHAVLAAKESA